MNRSNQTASPSGRRWKTVLAVLTVLVISAIAFSRRSQSVPIRATMVQRGDIRSVISTNGKVEPVQNFEAHAPVATTVARLYVKEGDHVKRGQLLLVLDDAPARAQSARAQTQMRAAQSDLSATERGGTQEEVLTTQTALRKARTDRDTAQRNLDALKRLQAQGAASAGEVQDAQNALAHADGETQLLEQKLKARYSKPEVARVEAQGNEAHASLESAASVLAKSNVRAPFDGVVYSLPVKPGAFVQEGDLLLQEGDLSKVLVRAFVDEPDVARLALTQKADVTWDAVSDRTWPGAVNSVPATVKLRGTRNVGESTILVDNSDLRLLPNINVNVTIVITEKHDALVLPRGAIRQDDSRPYVLLVTNDTLHRRDVDIAVSTLTNVEIRTGLTTNDVVALNSLNGKPLLDGISVKVVQ